MQTAILRNIPETYQSQEFLYYNIGNKFYLKGFLDCDIDSLNSLRKVISAIKIHLKKQESLELFMTFQKIDNIAAIGIIGLFRLLKKSTQEGKNINAKWIVIQGKNDIARLAKDIDEAYPINLEIQYK